MRINVNMLNSQNFTKNQHILFDENDVKIQDKNLFVLQNSLKHSPARIRTGVTGFKVLYA